MCVFAAIDRLSFDFILSKMTEYTSFQYSQDFWICFLTKESSNQPDLFHPYRQALLSKLREIVGNLIFSRQADKRCIDSEREGSLLPSWFLNDLKTQMNTGQKLSYSLIHPPYACHLSSWGIFNFDARLWAICWYYRANFLIVSFAIPSHCFSFEQWKCHFCKITPVYKDPSLSRTFVCLFLAIALISRDFWHSLSFSAFLSRLIGFTFFAFDKLSLLICWLWPIFNEFCFHNFDISQTILRCLLTNNEWFNSSK